LLLLDAWPLGRLRTARDLRTLVWEKAPYFILSALFTAITVFSHIDGQGMSDLEEVPFPDRVRNALVGYGAYLRMTVWPAEMGVMYPLHPRPWWQPAAAAAVLAGVTAAVVAVRKTAPYVLVGWLWFVGVMVP